MPEDPESFKYSGMALMNEIKKRREEEQRLQQEQQREKKEQDLNRQLRQPPAGARVVTKSNG